MPRCRHPPAVDGRRPKDEKAGGGTPEPPPVDDGPFAAKWRKVLRWLRQRSCVDSGVLRGLRACVVAEQRVAALRPSPRTPRRFVQGGRHHDGSVASCALPLLRNFYGQTGITLAAWRHVVGRGQGMTPCQRTPQDRVVTARGLPRQCRYRCPNIALCDMASRVVRTLPYLFLGTAKFGQRRA